MPVDTPPENAAAIRDGGVPNNIPIPRTSFVGREESLGVVDRLLESTRLLTLTGAGGCGKTRLAIEAVRRLANRYPDGVWLVELAPLTDPALIGPTIASAIGARESTGKPVVQILTEHLRTMQTLLVVDNCEHLIAGAAQIVDATLSECPRLVVLATSREALRIAGEVDWRVPSLAIPSARPIAAVEDVVDVESVRLFVERGRAIRTDFGVTSQNASAIAQICRQLDGIPLAIELAATHVNVLPVEQIAARLDQRFQLLRIGSRVALPRHQTLAALIGWSYDLLTDAERALFNRLSVFAGGFTLEAAEDVSPGSVDTLGELSELVRKPMVVADGEAGGVERYHLLETLRQYGLERLAATGEDTNIQQRRAAYYLRFAEAASPHLFQPEQLVYLRRLDREWDNIRTAFRWFVDQENANDGLRLAAALEMFFWYRGIDETEGQTWRTRLLNLPVPIIPSAVRANALLWTASTFMDWDDPATARSHFNASLMMARQVGDLRALAWIMHRISRYGGTDQEKWYGATDLELAEGAFDLFRAAEDRWGAAITQAWLGYLEHHHGSSERARLLLADAVVTARALGERHCIAFALRNLGEVISAERPAEAESDLRESLRLYQELSDIQGMAYVELLLGRLDFFRERYGSACLHYRASLRLYQDATSKEYMVQCLAGLAIVAVSQRQPGRAICLAGATAHLGTWTVLAVCPIEQVDLHRAITLAREELGDADLAALWAKGQAMTLEEAIAYALADTEAAAEAN
jgi:non-specific serine/threonine protein kinase